MKHINQSTNTLNSTNHQGQTPRRLSLALTVALSAIALTACGGGGSKGNSQSNAKGNNQGGTHVINPNHINKGTQGGKGSNGTKNTSSPINDTYYDIADYNSSDPDISKRYADVKEITIKNGKVTQEKISREIGTGSAPSLSNKKSNRLILAKNFSAKDNSPIDSLMDTKTKKSIWYPDKISGVITDSTTNNTIKTNLKIKYVDLSGKKAYNKNTNIHTTINDKNGSVSEVYPQGASCLGSYIETLQPADKVYLSFDPTDKYATTYTSFAEWQKEHKEHIKQQEALQMIGDVEKLKVGSNNEYDAQIIKVKLNDPDEKVQMTIYYSAIKYQGKIYDTSGLLANTYPNTKIIIAPDSPALEGADCMYYNKVAKDYIIAQLKTLP